MLASGNVPLRKQAMSVFRQDVHQISDCLLLRMVRLTNYGRAEIVRSLLIHTFEDAELPIAGAAAAAAPGKDVLSCPCSGHEHGQATAIKVDPITPCDLVRSQSHTQHFRSPQSPGSDVQNTPANVIPTLHSGPPMTSSLGVGPALAEAIACEPESPKATSTAVSLPLKEESSARAPSTPPLPEATDTASPQVAAARRRRQETTWKDPKLQRALQREVRRVLHHSSRDEIPLWPRDLAFAFGDEYNIFVRFRLPEASLSSLRESVWDAAELAKCIAEVGDGAHQLEGSVPAPDPEFVFELTLQSGFAAAPSVVCHTDCGLFEVGDDICMGSYSAYHVDNAYTFDLLRQVGALVQFVVGLLEGDDDLLGSVGVVDDFELSEFVLFAVASVSCNEEFSDENDLEWTVAR